VAGVQETGLRHSGRAREVGVLAGVETHLLDGLVGEVDEDVELLVLWPALDGALGCAWHGGFLSGLLGGRYRLWVLYDVLLDLPGPIGAAAALGGNGGLRPLRRRTGLMLRGTRTACQALSAYACSSDISGRARLRRVRILQGQGKQSGAREVRFLRSRHAMVAGDGREGGRFAHQHVGLNTIITMISSTRV
jgi:hypothetical protein